MENGKLKIQLNVILLGEGRSVDWWDVSLFKLETKNSVFWGFGFVCFLNNWKSFTLLLGVQNGAATMENSMKDPEKFKKNYLMIQPSHFWIFIQKD